MISRLVALAITVHLVSSGLLYACSNELVELRGPWGQLQFAVEVADDDQERGQGLMFREEMPSREGMLFVYDRPQRVGFWMKNTLLPLDMIFADETGVVTKVHEDAVPHDETLIDGGAGVQFVLEINAGLARRYGISVGSEVRHPTIDQAGAVWPCSTN